MYYRTIAAGEQSGNLDQVLRQIADYMEKAIGYEKKWKVQWTYPAIVLIVAIVVVVILVVFVSPLYESLFQI